MKKESKIKKLSFTLLEVMLVICIISLTSGGLYWKIHSLLERHQFETDVGSLKQALLQGRMMALNTKSDWQLSLMKGNKGWEGQLFCSEDGNGLIFSPRRVSMHSYNLFLDGKETRECTFNFYSTGLVEPGGILSLKKEDRKVEFSLSALLLGL
jgi:Tfp pilus assembly protein FimT